MQKVHVLIVALEAAIGDLLRSRLLRDPQKRFDVITVVGIEQGLSVLDAAEPGDATEPLHFVFVDGFGPDYGVRSEPGKFVQKLIDAEIPFARISSTPDAIPEALRGRFIVPKPFPPQVKGPDSIIDGIIAAVAI